jgi:hypothetical protein
MSTRGEPNVIPANAVAPRSPPSAASCRDRDHAYDGAMEPEPEPMYAVEYQASWRPSPTWAITLANAHAALAIDPRDGRAWAQVAMMLGDSGAAPLGLWVALHGRAVDPAARLDANLALFLLDLGLGAASPEQPGRVRPLPALDAWLERQLTPFGGDLARAARWALDLAVERTGSLDSDPSGPRSG